MLDQLRALPAAVRAVIAGVAGLLAAFLIYAATRKTINGKRERTEVSGAGGLAVAVIVWLLLQSGALSGSESTLPGDTGAPVSYLLPVRPGASWLFNIEPPTPDNWTVNLTPPGMLYRYPRPQAQTNCGCDQANDALSEFWRGLWDTIYAAGYWPQ
jgi:hypothetical protein